MPAPYIESMEQVATYWPPGANDGTGNIDYSAVVPVLITCRWQDTQALAIDAQGREFTSAAVVYPDRELTVQGYLALGDVIETGGPDPRSIPGAREIRNVQVSPSLDGTEVLYKATLG